MATLSQLSFPKGKVLNCELCGKPATRQCETCRCTYYCSREHQSVDTQGIHTKICRLLATVRAPNDEIGSEEDRERREKNLKVNQRKLIEVTKEEAAKYLVAQQFELAVPGALQSLRFSLAVFGEGHIDLVPAYLILAEANLGLGRMAQVEEFLSMANWSVLRNPDCSNGLRSKLHRNFGKLYASQGKHELALSSLAQDVYYASLEHGPDSHFTAGGYYHMGGVFLSQGNQDCGLAMFDKAMDSWYKYLSHVKASGSDEVATMTGAFAAESASNLSGIVEARERLLGSAHVATGEACYTLGLFKCLRADATGAAAALTAAHAAYSAALGAEHPSTVDVSVLLAEL